MLSPSEAAEIRKLAEAAGNAAMLPPAAVCMRKDYRPYLRREVQAWGALDRYLSSLTENKANE